MRRLSLLLLALAAACNPASETGLKLVTIDSSDAGLSLRELPPEVLRSVGLPFGLAVVRAGAIAERAGLKIGDVVYGINQKKAGNLEEFNRLLAEQDGRKLGLLVRRGGTDFYVAVDLDAAPPRDGMPRGAPPLPAKDTLLRT